MLTRLHLVSAGTLLLLFLAHSPAARAFLPRDAVHLSMEILVNPVGGPPYDGCRVSEEIQTRSTRDWLIPFWKTKLDSRVGSEGPIRGIRCGGDFVGMEPSDSKGPTENPRLIVEISTVAKLIRQMEDERVLEVDISFSVERLSGFEDDGEPVYQRSEAERSLFFPESQDVFVPVFVANETERKTLGLHEVFLKIVASAVGAESANPLGVVSVTTGMEGTAILLDGGVAGRTSAGGELILRNVPAGLRQVGLRDASGGEVSKVVRVIADRTVFVDLGRSSSEDDRSHYRLMAVGKNGQGYEEFRRGSDGAVVVKIPAGEFLMGNKQTERTPLEHRVFVSEYLLDKMGVTWAQFERFAEATGVPLPLHEPYWGIHDDHPVVYVTWEEAKAYCEWAGGRLPTEAEREKAARGTDERKYPWGNEEPDPERGVFRRTWGYEATGAVGKRPAGASPYGLLDMGGNVWEWCADWYDGEYYAQSPCRDPKGPPVGRAHVVRGGSWDSRPDVLSASCRNWGHRGYRDGDFGFRCAMNAPR